MTSTTTVSSERVPQRFRIRALSAAISPLVLAAIVGSSGCSIQSIARGFPVARIKAVNLQQYQDRLNARGIKSAGDIYIASSKKMDTIVEKNRRWEYVDRRDGNRKGYEMYNLRLQRTFSFGLKSVHVRIYRYWEKGQEKIKVYLSTAFMFGNYVMSHGSVDVFFDKERSLIAIHSPYAGGRTVFGYVSKWKKSRGLF